MIVLLQNNYSLRKLVYLLNTFVTGIFLIFGNIFTVYSDKRAKKAYLKLKNLENLNKHFPLSLSARTSNHNPRINSTLSPTNQL